MTATMNPTKPAQTKIPPAQPPPTNQVFTVPKALTAATVGQFLNSPFILDQIAKALPTHLKPERMIRMAVTLVRRTPALLECDPMTLVACIVQASELGLELSGPLGQAYMIPRRNKGKQECTFQIGYRGFIKLAYNTGQVAFYNARAVFAGDYFAYELGTEQYIKHRREAPPQAKITHFYAVLRQHNGAADCEVWSVGDVEAHRDRFRSDRFLKEKNKSYQGPWDTDFEAMGCKTLIRELAKRAPLSPELMSQAARDEYIERNEVAGRGTGGRLRWAEWGNDRGAGPGVAQGTARHAGCWGMNPRGSTARCRGTLAGGDTDPAAVGLNHERARSCWPCNFRAGGEFANTPRRLFETRMYRLWKLKRRRRAEVAKGNCGLCYQPRGRLKFLCDKCAAKHRERQQARKADRTKVVVSEWRRRHLVGLLAFLTHKRGLKEQSS